MRRWQRHRERARASDQGVGDHGSLAPRPRAVQRSACPRPTRGSACCQLPRRNDPPGPRPLRMHPLDSTLAFLHKRPLFVTLHRPGRHAMDLLLMQALSVATGDALPLLCLPWLGERSHAHDRLLPHDRGLHEPWPPRPGWCTGPSHDARKMLPHSDDSVTGAARHGHKACARRDSLVRFGASVGMQR